MRRVIVKKRADKEKETKTTIGYKNRNTSVVGNTGLDNFMRNCERKIFLSAIGLLVLMGVVQALMSYQPVHDFINVHSGRFVQSWQTPIGDVRLEPRFSGHPEGEAPRKGKSSSSRLHGSQF